jgi:transposase-like protein
VKKIIVIELKCRKCGSPKLVKNGHNEAGNQQYKCKDCKWMGILYPENRYSEERKAEILRTYKEQESMRGIERIFGVARQTVAKWLKKSKADTVRP